VEPVFEARNLLKRYGETVVLDVPALTVRDGEFAGLVGPNGSGKSTLVEILAGLQEPTSGEVRFRGRPLPPAQELAQHVVSVLQPAVLFRGTALSNVEYGLRARGVRRRERHRRAFAALERVGLAEKARQNGAALSRGERHRVALARALVLQTDVLLLDEPLTAVDSAHRGIVLEALAELRDQGRTLVMAAHDTDAVLALADQLLALEAGHLHQQPLVNVFRGCVELNNGMAEFITEGGLRFECLAARPGPARLAADPNAIILSRQPLESSARNCVQGVIRRLDRNGATTRVKLDAGDRLVAVITAATAGEMDLEPGDAVYATIKTSALRVLA
jgi:molybdopterin-binding protein